MTFVTKQEIFPDPLPGENVKHALAIVPLLVFACSAQAQFFGDTRSHQNDAYERYLACVKKYVDNSPVSELPPSDLASAAVSACDAQYQELALPTYQLFGYTQQAADILSETKQKARDYAIQAAIEARRRR